MPLGLPGLVVRVARGYSECQVGTREKGHACHRLPGVPHNVIMAEKKFYYFARWEQPRSCLWHFPPEISIKISIRPKTRTFHHKSRWMMHCHATGLIRFLMHGRCTSIIWRYNCTEKRCIVEWFIGLDYGVSLYTWCQDSVVLGMAGDDSSRIEGHEV